MTRGSVRWQAIRVVTIVLFVVVAIIGARRLSHHPSNEIVKPSSGEISTHDALTADPRKQVTVRGYVFQDSAGLRLCGGLVPGKPPRCFGQYLRIQGTDEGSFSFSRGVRKGETIRWVKDPLGLTGSVDGPTITVQSILR